MPPQPRVPLASRGDSVSPVRGSHAASEQQQLSATHAQGQTHGQGQGPQGQVQTHQARAQHQQQGTPGAGYSSQPMGSGYGGMMGGGYGGGMGYGGMGYGGMGMGMMGMNPMMGILSGPMSLIYSLNFFIASLGQIMEVLGMNAHVIINLYRTTYEAYRQIVERIRTSESRRWLQRKCKKSRLLRWLLIVASCAVVGSAVKVVQFYVDWRRRRMISDDVGGSIPSGGLSSAVSLFRGAFAADAANSNHADASWVDRPSPPAAAAAAASL